MGGPHRWSVPSLVMAAVAACLCPASGGAQICGGLPSLREQPLLVGASFTRSRVGWATGGDVTWGRAAFVDVAVGYVRYQDVTFAASTRDAHSAVFHVGVGYEAQAAVAGRRVIGVCPAGFVEYETGPDGDFGTRLDSDAFTAALGASVGAVALERGSFRLIPYAGLAYARVRTTVHDVPFAGTDAKDTEYGGLLDAGVGVVFGTVTIGPAVSVPIGFRDAEVSYGLSVSLSLGSAPRAGSSRP